MAIGKTLLSLYGLFFDSDSSSSSKFTVIFKSVIGAEPTLTKLKY